MAAKMDAASKFRSMQANPRVSKHYRSKNTRKITETIQSAFNDRKSLTHTTVPFTFVWYSFMMDVIMLWSSSARRCSRL
ncbi:hypothetical protein JVT61DRAFT_4038 [Boletus reticuloceps]|uniref:Uncharacterized protein n=1 Tax=Boletus reticuloceps TaxID=495285 RepID=A0A8I3A7L0_9AGAM|nr:hypothetical protein JVT61DRAFT_4038 [Boletus reticuloceps]